MYIAAGQGQTTPWGHNFDVNRNLSLCRFADYANWWEVREMRVKGMTFEGSGTAMPHPCYLLSLIPGKLVIFFPFFFLVCILQAF